MIKNKYDVIMVGAGIANIMGALRLIKTDPTLSILMLEKGPSIRNRGCPKSKVCNERIYQPYFSDNLYFE